MDDWGAIEEVLLLDAVEHDGFGNWYALLCLVWCVVLMVSIARCAGRTLRLMW